MQRYRSKSLLDGNVARACDKEETPDAISIEVAERIGGDGKGKGGLVGFMLKFEKQHPTDFIRMLAKAWKHVSDLRRKRMARNLSIDSPQWTVSFVWRSLWRKLPAASAATVKVSRVAPATSNMSPNNTGGRISSSSYPR
jgi:hypothetical protein